MGAIVQKRPTESDRSCKGTLVTLEPGLEQRHPHAPLTGFLNDVAVLL